MSEQNSSNGIGALSLLGVAFVVLKLAGIIDWSWWYVTMPFWIGIAFVIILIIIYVILYFITD